MATTGNYTFDFGGQFPTTIDTAIISPPLPSPGISPSTSKSAGGPRKIQRNRASYSCHSCRRRKVKCDRQHPTCGNCTKTGEGCTYSDNTGKESKKSKNARSSFAARTNQESSQGPKKRRRTMSSSPTNDDSGDEYTPTPTSTQSSRTNSMNLTLSDLPMQFEPSLPTPPLQTLAVLKEGELETRVNRLAEIVDRWCRDAYPRGVSPLSMFRPETTGLGTKERSASSASLQSQSMPVEERRSHTTASDTNLPTRRMTVPQVKKEQWVENLHAPPDLSGRLAMHGNESEVEELALGHLNVQDGGRSRYVGSSFWALLSSEISELNTVLKHSDTGEEQERQRRHGLSTPSPSTHPPSPSLEGMPYQMTSGVDKATLLNLGPSSAGHDLPEIILSLPPQHLCNVLYKSFSLGVHPVMPLIHAPTFIKEYQAFWSWHPEHTQLLSTEPTFVPLLCAVLYAGAMSMPASRFPPLFDGRKKDTITSHLYAATTSALATTSFPHSPTVNSLIAFLIVQTCLIREEEPLTSCTFVGTAMRVGMSMGLHREGALYGLSGVEAEVRRRVWWHILYLDVQGAIATGLSPLGGRAEELFDTAMVSDLRDEFLGADPSNPTETASPIILAQGRYENTILLRKIICRLFGIRPAKKKDLMELSEMIEQHKRSLDEKIARIPVLARGGKNDEAAVFNEWARSMLSMLADRAYAVLYLPFLKSTKSKLWLHARNCALHASHSFLRNFIHLSRAPQFRPYTWFCPGTYQPLHATMIVLLDLYERPLALEAARSRAYVDDVFALFAEAASHSGALEDGPRPLKEGGREAWRILGRLRSRAYNRATADMADQEAGLRSAGFVAGDMAPQQQFFHAPPQYVLDADVMNDMALTAAGSMDGLEMQMQQALPPPPPSSAMDDKAEMSEDLDWAEWDTAGFFKFVHLDRAPETSPSQTAWTN